MSRTLRVATTWALSALVSIALILTLVAPLYGAFRWDRAHVLAAAAMVAIILTTWTLRLNNRPTSAGRHRWSRSLVMLSFAGMLLTQMQIGRALTVRPGFDAGAVYNMASAMSVDVPLSAAQLDYISTYPNNWALIGILRTWFGLSIRAGNTDLLMSAVILNALALTAAAFFGYLTLRRIGRPIAAYLFLAFAWVFLALSPWIAVAYSDTLTMPFTAALFYLFSLTRSAPHLAARCGLWTAMAAISAVGYQLKPTAIFALAAAVLVAATATHVRTRGQ